MIRWLFTLFILIKLILALDTNKFCLNSFNKCERFYNVNNKLKISCITPRCKGVYTFQCMEYCSLTSHACSELLQITFGPDKHKRNENLFEKVKNCTEHKWNPSEICYKVFAWEKAFYFKDFSIQNFLTKRPEKKTATWDKNSRSRTEY